MKFLVCALLIATGAAARDIRLKRGSEIQQAVEYHRIDSASAGPSYGEYQSQPSGSFSDASSSGYDRNSEYSSADGAGDLSSQNTGTESSEGQLSHVTLTKEVQVPHPVPVPVEIEKKVPYPVYVPVYIKVDKPYPVKIYKPYAVPVYKDVPVRVYKDVPIPVKVPVEVPYPVRVPVLVPKPYPIHIPVSVPVQVHETKVIKKAVVLEHEEEKNGLAAEAENFASNLPNIAPSVEVSEKVYYENGAGGNDLNNNGGVEVQGPEESGYGNGNDDYIQPGAGIEGATELQQHEDANQVQVANLSDGNNVAPHDPATEESSNGSSRVLNYGDQAGTENEPTIQSATDGNENAKS